VLSQICSNNTCINKMDFEQRLLLFIPVPVMTTLQRNQVS
jgi:hypothetical protein